MAFHGKENETFFMIQDFPEPTEKKSGSANIKYATNDLFSS